MLRGKKIGRKVVKILRDVHMKKGLKGMRFVDLFAGLGGFHLALKSLGAKCVMAVEWDESVSAVYEQNFKLKPRGDITQLKTDEVPVHEILCGGFPCQAFSISGKRLGFNDTRGTLFFDVARIVKDKRPKVVFLENVKNFAQHDGGKTLKTVIGVLEQLNYDVYYKVLHSAKLGYATARERIYIVAFDKSLKVKENNGFEFPAYVEPAKYKKVKDCLEIIEDPTKMHIQGSHQWHVDISKPLPKKGSKVPHSPVRLGTIGKGGQGNRIYSIEGPAITLCAYGGGRASKTGAYLINGIVRKLTPRECANIMGFPKHYKIAKNANQAYKHFGNSVVVGVITDIAKKIQATLEQSNGEDRSAT